MKIKVKEITPGCKFEIIEKGDWIDLRAAEDVELKAPQAETLKTRVVEGERVSYRNVLFDVKMIGLGIAMQLPKGYEAYVKSRSGTFKNFGIVMSNAEATIDNCYNGNSDEWKYQAIAFKNTIIKKGDRICQFRIQLSQKATTWQKIKWLFSSKIKFEWVDKLGDNNRGGFSTTGVK